MLASRLHVDMSKYSFRTGMAKVSQHVELCYEDWGNESDPVILLIMGLSAQMYLWPDGFVAALVDKGYRVIRFDNRDIGLSTKIREKTPKLHIALHMSRYTLGLKSPALYSLQDMAADSVGLLEYLGIQKAHVVGASMGGMIAQIIAAEYATKVLSLGIVFSTNNQAFLPPPHHKALGTLMKGPGKGADHATIINHSVKLMGVIGSPGFPLPEHELRAFAERMIARSYHPAGVKRQFLAILSSGSLRPYDKKIRVPTVVIHGKEDVLVRPSCGKAVAKAIKSAELHLIPGMGHDIPRPLWPHLSHLLHNNIQKTN